MENEFDIEISIEETNEMGDVQLPLNFLSFGDIESDDVKVYIKQDVYKDLEKFAASNTSKELGTILIGDYCEQHGKIHVVISNYIEAKYTDASASTLTFTHKTWDYVHKQHDILCPDRKIVGWQHTHPNYGIFLSNYDLFIQENFFNMPFQIAYVIDPIQNIRGFFQWKNGKIEKLKGYYIYDEVGKPVKIEQKKTENTKSKQKSDLSKMMVIILSLLCVVTIGLSIFTININNKYNEQIKMQATAVEQMQQQEKIIAEQEQKIDDLQIQLIDSVLDNSGTTTAQNLIDKIENKEIDVVNRDQILSDLKSLVKNDNDDALESDEESMVTFKAYTVEAGDTLQAICEKKGIDYYGNKNIILSLNGISDSNIIYVGQIILLPIS